MTTPGFTLTRTLLLLTKPVRPGEVKTRLIGELGAERAAALHGALLEDLLERLAGGRFRLRVAWALDEGEALPGWVADEVRQQGEGLGERLYGALAAAARERAAAGERAAVAAVGSDHPQLTAADVERAFERLDAGAQVVIGPSRDGGYYLIALRSEAVREELFEGVPWSSERVLEATLERCRRLGLVTERLAEGWDVDRPADLRRLEAWLEAGGAGSPRTRRLLAGWRRERGEEAR